MRRYTYQKNKKSRKEKIGFFTAFSICIVAVAMALWSSFASIGGYDNANINETTYTATLTQTEAVDNQVTGITVEETEETTQATESPAETTQSYSGEDALATMLQVSASLDYPVESRKVIKEYSEDAVYSKTMGDWRAHTGIDISAKEGEDVLAMSDGVVEQVYTDPLLGEVIKVTQGNFSVLYCGIGGKIYCVQGQEIVRGEVLGQVGAVPCESEDNPHIHIEVRVGDKSIDPLTVISSDE